jgi:hypothetical protein
VELLLLLPLLDKESSSLIGVMFPEKAAADAEDCS